MDSKNQAKKSHGGKRAGAGRDIGAKDKKPRTRSPKETTKDVRAWVRLTPAQKIDLQSRATAAGCKTLSAYMLSLIYPND